MPLPPKMHSFQAEIGGDQHLVAGGDAEDGAVIADAGGQRWLGSNPPTKGGNQGSFR